MAKNLYTIVNKQHCMTDEIRSTVQLYKGLSDFNEIGCSISGQ